MIFDFVRLEDPGAFAAVLALSPGASPQLVADGRASEAAAWTPAELRALLDACALRSIVPAERA